MSESITLVAEHKQQYFSENHMVVMKTKLNKGAEKSVMTQQ
jgi:hypothetical protein